MYRLLSKIATSIPRVYLYAEDMLDNYNVLVMDRLGSSLEGLFNYCGSRFSLKTVLMLSDQMIDRLETIHRNRIIHRDLKPHNFLIGTQHTLNSLYLIDFGLAKEFMVCNSADSTGNTTYRHIPMTEGHEFVGTCRYAALNVHKGLMQSPRDDMESLGYILVYFMRGSLPWQNLRVSQATNRSRKQRNERLLEMKMSTPLSDLCIDLPDEFHVFLTYCRSRYFEEKLDYVYLRRIFR